MKLKPPCYKCEERKLGCHGSCDKYKEYRDMKDKQNNEVNKIKEVGYWQRDYIVKAVRRSRKASGR